MKLDSLNPHDQSVVGEVMASSKSDIETAVARAREAFKEWKETDIAQRAAYIKKFADEMIKHKEELAKLIALEVGKPYKEALEDIELDQDFLNYYVQEGPKVLQPELVGGDGDALRKVVREPIGVCAVITPWNFPSSNAVWGVMPNLVAGNTVVFKPSEESPLCAQKIVSMLESIGLPDGVVSIVQGDGDVGAMLIEADVDLVWFTGSSAVGHEIYKKCAEKFIPCLLELGGSSPAIVMDDANLDNALENVYFYRFLNCGQVCDAIKRLFVHKKIYKEFVRMLVERVEKARVGNPFDDVDFGPLVSKKQLKLLMSQVEDAVEKGAKIETGGRQPTDKALGNGNYYLPTILTDVTFDMRVLQEEVFGPVLPVMPFESVDEVISMANNTKYGLSAQIYSDDLETARRIANNLEAGTVAINSSNYLSPACPFGGYKKSGMGREGGKYGFYELTQVKYVYESRT